LFTDGALALLMQRSDVLLNDSGMSSGDVAGPMFQNVRPPPSRDAEGLHLVVESGPCGRAWVRPHWDTPPEVAGGQPGVTFCANAGPMGMIAASITRKHGEVVCTGMGRGVDAR